jgi:hypothetical protein
MGGAVILADVGLHLDDPGEAPASRGRLLADEMRADERARTVEGWLRERLA